MNINLETNVESVTVTAMGYNSVQLEISELDPDDVLAKLDAGTVIDYYGIDEILSAMDKDEVIKFYGIEEQDEASK